MKKESIDNNILAHASWNCKYHVVFAPKYRRKVFFEKKTVGDKRDSSEIMPMERRRNN